MITSTLLELFILLQTTTLLYLRIYLMLFYLNIIVESKTDWLIAGNYNADLLKSKVHSDTERFVNNLYSNLFIPSILDQRVLER